MSERGRQNPNEVSPDPAKIALRAKIYGYLKEIQQDAGHPLGNGEIIDGLRQRGIAEKTALDIFGNMESIREAINSIYADSRTVSRYGYHLPTIPESKKHEQRQEMIRVLQKIHKDRRFNKAGEALTQDKIQRALRAYKSNLDYEQIIYAWNYSFPDALKAAGLFQADKIRNAAETLAEKRSKIRAIETWFDNFILKENDRQEVRTNQILAAVDRGDLPNEKECKRLTNHTLLAVAKARFSWLESQGHKLKPKK